MWEATAIHVDERDLPHVVEVKLESNRREEAHELHRHSHQNTKAELCMCAMITKRLPCLHGWCFRAGRAWQITATQEMHLGDGLRMLKRIVCYSVR